MNKTTVRLELARAALAVAEAVIEADALGRAVTHEAVRPLIGCLSEARAAIANAVEAAKQ